jgi:hypothetical protein
MQDSKLFVPLKIVGYLVLLSMLAALGYSLAVAFMHWSGIAV